MIVTICNPSPKRGVGRRSLCRSAIAIVQQSCHGRPGRGINLGFRVKL
jgi:hypothetical protein